MPANTAVSPARAEDSEVLKSLLAQPAILWQALDRLVILATQEPDAPATSELAAYAAGTLPLDQVEKVRDYVAIHPEALVEAGGPSLLADESAPSSSVEKLAVWSVLQWRLRAVHPSAELEPVVALARSVMRSWFRETRLDPGELHVGRVRGFVAALYDWIGELNGTVSLRATDAALLRQATLQSCFPVLALCRAGLVDLAAQYLVLEWRNVGSSFGVVLPGSEFSSAAVAQGSGRPLPFEEPSERQLIWAFQTAVLELLRTEETQRSGRDTVTELMSKLDLSYAQVGDILDASEKTVRDWHVGAAPIPQAKLGLLSLVEDALDRLTIMFLPERLPQVIRRQAGLFAGETALGWILQGRIREVADSYDLLLRYQA